MRQPGEMGEAAGNSGLMARAFQARGDSLVAAGTGQIGAAIEHAVVGIDRFGVIIGAGIGARRVSGDQIVDLQPVLDGPDALFERAALFDHDFPPDGDLFGGCNLRYHSRGSFSRWTLLQNLASLWR